MHEQLTQWWESISLRSKITGVTVLVVTLGLLVVGTGTLTVLQRTLVDEVDRQITQASEELPRSPDSFTLDDFDSFTDLTPSIFSNPFYFGAVDADAVLIDDNVSESSRAQAPDVSRLTAEFVDELDGGITITSTDRTTQWRIITFPLRVTDADSGETTTATLLIGADLADANAIISSFASVFLGFGLVVVILSAALTRMLVTSTFTPLRDVEATAARFASGDFSQRLGGATPNTEVGRLNRSLNTMLSRIDRAFADRASTISQMRRFVGDASHELRTPLVSVRGYAELYRMGALATPDDVAQAMERIEKEAIRMGALVSDLLELARLDESRPLELARVDLVPLARDAALDAMASSPDRDVTVVIDDAAPSDDVAMDAALTHDVPGSAPAASGLGLAGSAFARLRGRRGRRPAASIPGPDPTTAPLAPAVEAVVIGEENKLRQVITNLIGNALRFSPDGSPIELVVGVDPAAGRASIAVVDHGDGIPPQLKEKIFERFFRADSSRARDTGGSGLGLAIVASIVALHQGRVEVLDTPGGGATFRVALPLASASPLLPTEHAATDAALEQHAGPRSPAGA
ncbi:sensor histidine kinase [Microcella humidisoli]|uniref:histidine kinase n=1 Tax=Microcella humidisoli TaxID=2963406 RepID=A0ABY5FU93_9MICO|nr:HAMP domain-containing sensor histidine kinase [Microcella humidisoli]UTT61502.1 HAMP domain-containing histidine kinase [Microcella humidisoli]